MEKYVCERREIGSLSSARRCEDVEMDIWYAISLILPFSFQSSILIHCECLIAIQIAARLFLVVILESSCPLVPPLTERMLV